MTHSPQDSWLRNLFGNNRFWILAAAVTISVNVAGFIQLQIPNSTLQVIRTEQVFGFISLACLYLAVIISPLVSVFPKLPGKGSLIFARRAIGVSAFYFAALHVYISYFLQLGGFSNLAYLNGEYSISLLLGIFAFGVLGVMAATSFDVVVAKFGYKSWKRLHRLVYVASVAILVHVLLIGSHFEDGITPTAVITLSAATVLVALEVMRLVIALKSKRHGSEKTS